LGSSSEGAHEKKRGGKLPSLPKDYRGNSTGGLCFRRPRIGGLRTRLFPPVGKFLAAPWLSRRGTPRLEGALPSEVSRSKTLLKLSEELKVSHRQGGLFWSQETSFAGLEEFKNVFFTGGGGDVTLQLSLEANPIPL